jgi:dCMP deaminase
MLANARINRFVTFGKYADDAFLDLFKEVGIGFDLMPRPPFQITRLD